MTAIYLRKSRADREAEARGEGETLARHESILTELANHMGLVVEAVYKELVSGETIAARPKMQQLLLEVMQGEMGKRYGHGGGAACQGRYKRSGNCSRGL